MCNAQYFGNEKGVLTSYLMPKSGDIVSLEKQEKFVPADIDIHLLSQNNIKQQKLQFSVEELVQIVNSSKENLNKAMWLYLLASEPPQQIDWWGYYKFPDAQKKSWYRQIKNRLFKK